MSKDRDILICAGEDPVGYANNQAKMAALSDAMQADFESWLCRNAPQSHLVMRDVMDSFWYPEIPSTTAPETKAEIVKRLLYIGYQRCLEGIDRAAELAKESA